MSQLLFILKHWQNYDPNHKTLCITGWRTICQTRTICQALQVLDDYSCRIILKYHKTDVHLKQKYYFMHFKCMIIIFVQKGTYLNKDVLQNTMHNQITNNVSNKNNMLSTSGA